MLTSRHTQRGTSLIELLVVTGVIGLLISILLPALGRAREAARETVCLSNLKQVGNGLFSYATGASDYGPQVMERMGTTAPRTLLSRSGEHVNLGLLLAGSALADPRVFYCPSQSQFWYNAEPSLIPAATVTGSYAYGIQLPAGTAPQFGRLRHLAMASDDYVARLGAPHGIGRYSHEDGYNVLYTDGSVLWYEDADSSIAERGVHWDDETDDVNYATLYREQSVAPSEQGDYGDELDIFRVWWSFCYKEPDPFGQVD